LYCSLEKILTVAPSSADLITNAIKFTQHSAKRSIKVHVSVSPVQPDLAAIGLELVPQKGVDQPDVTSGEDWGTGERLYLRVDVEDTGCGLTVEEKELLFKRFAQASPRTHVTYGGSGLGLFISRQLAILHGGHIGVTSEAGKGSTFGFFIRCRRVGSDDTRSELPKEDVKQALKHDHDGQLVAAISGSEHKKTKTEVSRPEVPRPEVPRPEVSRPEGSTPEVSKPTEPDKRHILLVEDNLVNQKILSKQLVKAGCIVSTADNGVFALEHLRTTQFYKSTINGVPLSIILMDWEMPEMDGITCCKCIRQMEANDELAGHVPIIGVTANVRAEQLLEAKESGMDEVVAKPFRVPQLLTKIEEVLHTMRGRG
jgi:CheY-like chemotaxis protein